MEQPAVAVRLPTAVRLLVLISLQNLYRASGMRTITVRAVISV
jgi:hypothetical protein